jgi:hypothetical protein
VGTVRRLVGACVASVPGNLMVFVAAIFLAYGVTAFATIYAVPGHPVHAFAQWCSFAASMVAAALWTALSVMKERIEKATASGPGGLAAHDEYRMRLWRQSWLQALAYLGGAAAFSVLALVILIFP